MLRFSRLCLCVLLLWGGASVAVGQVDTPLTGSKAGEGREITLTGGVKLKLIWCPPGTFTMGTAGGTDDEAPVQVTITKGFWLAATETTQAQFTAVMGTSPWVENGNTDFYKAGPNFPVAYITHHEAAAYCDKLTEIERKSGRLPTGWKYALPTEAQWEYAARAETTGPYSFEGNESQLGEYAWFKENAYDTDEHYGHMVGMKKPNPWGLYDIHGNLMECCRDGVKPKLTGGSDPFAAPSKEDPDQVNRGGSWYNTSMHCRSTSRNYPLEGRRSGILGFRPATVPVVPDK